MDQDHGGSQQTEQKAQMQLHSYRMLLVVKESNFPNMRKMEVARWDFQQKVVISE